MRLIGLALIFVLLAGTAQILLDRHGAIVDFLVSKVDNGAVDLVFETPDAPYLDAEINGAALVDLSPSSASEFRALRKFPDQTDLTFRLPSRSSIDYGTLHLDLRSTLVATSNGIISVLVNGKTRGEVLLPHGAQITNLHVSLEKDDLDQGQVNVSLHAIGQSQSATCSASGDFGVLVEMLPTTRLSVVFAQDLDPISASFALAGDPARIIWPALKNNVLQKDLLALAHNLSAQNVLNAAFVPRTRATPRDLLLDEAAIDATAQALLPDQAQVRVSDGTTLGSNGAWPVAAFSAVTDTQTKQFTTQNEWHMTYRQAEMPGGLLPGWFDFEMALTGAAANERYLLVASLNGEMFHSETLEAAQTQIARSLDLSGAKQRAENELRLTLLRSSEKANPCDTELPIMAQLKPGARLHKNSDAIPDEFGNLIAHLGNAPRVDINLSSPLDATQAQNALALLRASLPDRLLGTSYRALANKSVTISVASSRAVSESYKRVRSRGGGPGWIVWRDHNDELTVAQLGDFLRLRALFEGGDQTILVVSDEGIGL